MIISTSAFAVMQILIAATADTIPLFEQIFFRNIFGCIGSFVVIKKAGNVKLFGTGENKALLLLRSFFGFLAVVAMFFAVRSGNPGDIALITRLSPFIVIIGAAVFLKEKITKAQIIGLIVATVGCYITANPSYTSDFLPIVAAVFNVVCAGSAYIIIGKLKGRENPHVIVFTFALFTSIIAIFLMIPEFVIPSLEDLILLIGISIMAYIGQVGLTLSYTNAKASDVSIFNYLGIPVAMVLGYLFLSQPIKSTTLIGSLFVVGSSLIILLSKDSGDNK